MSQPSTTDERELPQEGFVRVKQIIGDREQGIPAVIPVSKTDWWEGVKQGRYPQPLKLSPKITVWRVEDIRQLIEELQVPMQHTPETGVRAGSDIGPHHRGDRRDRIRALTGLPDADGGEHGQRIAGANGVVHRHDSAAVDELVGVSKTLGGVRV